MAAPAFVFLTISFATMQQRLRLSGVVAGTDAMALIEDAVRNARVGLFRRLSASRISELQAIVLPAATDPVTAQEALRRLAETTELKWIRMELMRTIPTQFFDSSPAADQQWQAEGMLRGMSSEQIEKEICRLDNDIELAMDALRGDEDLPNETDNRLQVVVPTCTPPRPAQAVWRPGYGRIDF